MVNSKFELSVILPVYNGMPYLENAIDSILSQSFKNFILLVINNGSTDRTAEYVKSISDDRVKYFYLEDNNLVNALNFGLAKVETEFIARMDADDICESQRFENQIRYLKANPDIGVLGTWGKYFGANKKRRIKINLPIKNDEIVKSMLMGKHAIIHASVMFRNSSIEGESYNKNYFPCEDFELFLRLADKTKLANLPFHHYNFRIRKNSVIGKNIKKSIDIYKNISHAYSKKGEKRSFLNKLFLKIDLEGIYLYRKGLDYYLNRRAIVGFFYFAIAALLSPARVLERIKRITFR